MYTCVRVFYLSVHISALDNMLLHGSTIQCSVCQRTGYGHNEGLPGERKFVNNCNRSSLSVHSLDAGLKMCDMLVLWWM